MKKSKRTGRPSNLRVFDRHRVFGLVFETLNNEVFPLAIARLKEALSDPAHPHCWDLVEKCLRIQAEIVAASTVAERGSEPPAQQTLPWPPEVTARLIGAMDRTRVLDADLATAAAPTRQ